VCRVFSSVAVAVSADSAPAAGVSRLKSQLVADPSLIQCWAPAAASTSTNRHPAANPAPASAGTVVPAARRTLPAKS
jgi:hypothetical protein